MSYAETFPQVDKFRGAYKDIAQGRSMVEGLSQVRIREAQRERREAEAEPHTMGPFHSFLDVGDPSGSYFTRVLAPVDPEAIYLLLIGILRASGSRFL